MNIIQRAIRGFLRLGIASCLLGLAIPGQAQQLTVTPTVPETYQSFVVTILVPCGDDALNAVFVDIDMSARSIVVGVRSTDYPECPLNPKLAAIMGLPGGVYSVERRVLPDGGVDQAYGELTIAPAPPTQPVFAFYNGEIGHYFITAGIAERDSLVGGGGGWYLVDEGFNA
ncbi:MAG: hypothetical protein WBN86_03160, partial [Porticoccaceae bacterium]